MITLHIAAWLAQEGFGVLALTGSEPNAEIFWEEMPVDQEGNAKNGIWVVTRGTPVTRFDVTTQAFDIYSRYADKLTGSRKLKDILNRLQEAYGDTCDLPTVEAYSDDVYTEVSLIPVSGIENVGSDEQDKIVRVISGEVRFKEVAG